MNEALNGWSQANPPRNWSTQSAKLAVLNDAKIDQLVQNLNLVFGDGRATDELKKIAGDDQRDIATRRRAIAALAKSSEAPKLFEFFKSQVNNKALTTEVTKALVRCDEPQAASVIINRYPHMDPEGQLAAVNVLVARSPWAKRLLDEVGKNRIPKSAINASHARQIRNFGDESLNASLAAVWGEIRETSAERLGEIQRFRRFLTADLPAHANLEVGRNVYEKTCASCHTLFGKGGKIGPDLTGSDRKNLNYLLENIVDPSASVAESYQSSVIALEDGRFLTGVIVNENERTIQLQTKDELLTVDRTMISERKKTKKSLMPDGLLNDLTDEQIGSLFHFLAK
jgi:putative heme-binding domain-containing protein